MKRSGFTIIEMLVVVIIIAILAGLVFKMIGAGGASADKAKARRQLEAIANACEEYRAEYGRYPPVAKDSKGNQPFAYDYPRSADRWTGGSASSLATLLNKVSRTQATVFKFGLMSFLVTRVEGRAELAPKELFDKGSLSDSQHHWRSQNDPKNSDSKDLVEKQIKAGLTTRPDGKNGSVKWDPKKHCCAVDNPRDVRAARKIWPLIKDVIRTEESYHEYNGNVYTNLQCSVWDPWNNTLNYRSDPPFDSYRLWSNGPDGKSGTADDIIAGNEN